MDIFTKKEDLQKHLSNLFQPDDILGFVPTMGALHIGHISLVNKSLENCSYTVVSIFVNPTQFNNNEDLHNYPRTLESDVALLKKTSEKIIVFSPNAENLYNGVPKSEKFDFKGIENLMEGKFRPGHFDGVGTVLTLLFNAVKPNKAYFGEKDYQQLQVVKKLAEIKNFDIEIIGCEIYRETNGLAYSSRNERLTNKQREEAKLLYDVLNIAKKHFGTKNVKEIYEMVSLKLKESDILDLEYFEIANAETLVTVNEVKESIKYRAFIAAFAGEVRLIDNIALN